MTSPGAASRDCTEATRRSTVETFVHDNRDAVMNVLLSLSKAAKTIGSDLDKIFTWFLKQVCLDHLTGHLLG